MSDYPVMRGSRPSDPHPTLRLAALTAVIAGVVLVAGAAFLLSYNGIHQIALQAGVSPGLARLYPLMFDAMLVIACAAALALRNAGWGAKCYVWVSLLLLVCTVAAGDALHATGVRLDGQAARAAIAIIPWVLLMMGFGMWLVMLRQWRRARAAAAAGGAAGSRAGQTGQNWPAVAGGAAAGGAVTWAGGRDAPRARPGASGAGTDTLLERPAGRAPDRAPAAESLAAGERFATKEQQNEQRHTGTPDERQPAGTAVGTAGKGHDGGREGGPGDPNGGADQAGNGTARVGGRDMPASGVAEGNTTFEALPAGAAGPGGAAGAASATGAAGAAGAAGPGAAAGSAASGDDNQAPEADTQAGDGDHAETPPPMPAPAPLPLFDRLRSTPTPPQETGASGE